MNIYGILLWGFAATVVLTTIMSLSRPMGLTRMDLPFLLGTIWTGDRHRARWIGFIMHLLIGWLFAFIYAAAFEQVGSADWRFGAMIGLVHSLFVLAVGMPAVSAIHPRMASEDQGPDPTRQLEPPGFMIFNYGRRTPLVTIAAHIVYGAILGLFYVPM